MEANGLPSRTAILTAAARALGSREPDASVRNPDGVADRLIGPAELALISDHPISKAFDHGFREAMDDPDVFGFVWLMLVRTRYIDEMMERAIHNGASQLVILGAGFDSRAHRFESLLKNAAVVEIDHAVTQAYKKARVEAALGHAPANVVYAPIDFAQESLGGVLRHAGLRRDRKTYFLCEGLSMYVPEEGMKETLRAISAESAPGSAVLFEYLNRRGLELLRKYPMGMIKNAFDWGEPFVFGVPDGQDNEYFQNLNLRLGEALKIGSPASVQRYAVHSDGRREAAQAAATSGAWLAELTVSGGRFASVRPEAKEGDSNLAYRERSDAA